MSAFDAPAQCMRASEAWEAMLSRTWASAAAVRHARTWDSVCSVEEDAGGFASGCTHMLVMHACMHACMCRQASRT